MESQTLTIDEAAQLLGIGRSLAYSLAASDRMPGLISLGRRRLVSRVQLEAFLAGKPDPVAVEA